MVDLVLLEQEERYHRSPIRNTLEWVLIQIPSL